MKMPRRHLAYLLRLWPVARNGENLWRASLEDVDTGERRGFASLSRLFDFLGRETCSAGASCPDDDRKREGR